jgi:hypothetical protein
MHGRSEQQRYDVATTQLAIDRRVEQGEIANRHSINNPVRIDQTWFGRSGGLAPINLPLFHGVQLLEVERPRRRHLSSAKTRQMRSKASFVSSVATNETREE